MGNLVFLSTLSLIIATKWGIMNQMCYQPHCHNKPIIDIFRLIPMRLKLNLTSLKTKRNLLSEESLPTLLFLVTTKFPRLFCNEVQHMAPFRKYNDSWNTIPSLTSHVWKCGRPWMEV